MPLSPPAAFGADGQLRPLLLTSLRVHHPGRGGLHLTSPGMHQPRRGRQGDSAPGVCLSAAEEGALPGVLPL